jgi:hypothetical protein
MAENSDEEAPLTGSVEGSQPTPSRSQSSSEKRSKGTPGTNSDASTVAYELMGIDSPSSTEETIFHGLGVYQQVRVKNEAEEEQKRYLMEGRGNWVGWTIRW